MFLFFPPFSTDELLKKEKKKEKAKNEAFKMNT